MAKHHASTIIDVSVLPDAAYDTVANSVWVNYIENGKPQRTNAPDIALDDETRDRLTLLLQSAIKQIKTNQ